MVAPSSKTPRIVNADKTAIVKDPGTLVWNNQTDRLEVVDNAFNFVPTGGGGTIPDNVILQQLWVNAASGSDANDGGEYTPFASYAAATAFAALTSSPTNRFVINLIGDFTQASPLLYPFIDLVFHAGTFTVTGGWSLDASWDTVVNNEIVTIQGMKLAGFWSFSWIANTGNIVRFLNCDHSLTTSGNFLSNSPAVNALQIINDTALAATSYSGNLFVSQSPSVLFNATVAGEIRYDVLQDGYTLNHYLLNSTIPFGIILKKSVPNTSTQVVHIQNTPMPAGSPVLEDVLCTAQIDTVSYLSDPTLLLDGAYSQLITKGVNGIRQQLWVNAAVGNDLNNGGLNQPFATYDAARAAAAAVASPTNRFLIKVIGNQTALGDILINPYIDLDFEDCIFTSGDASFGIGLDAAWGPVTNEKVYISGFRPVSAIGLNATFAATTNVADWLVFINCNFEQCPNGNVGSAGGFGSAGNDNGVAFFGSSNPLGNNFSSGLSINQVKSRIENMAFGAGVSCILSEDDYFIHHYISNCSMTDLTNVRFGGNGSQYLHVRNCNVTNPITLDVQLGTITIDSNSYSQPITLGSFNTFADVIIYNSTDGMIMNTFTPVNFAFVVGNYVLDALTGWLKGIDAQLGALGPAFQRLVYDAGGSGASFTIPITGMSTGGQVQATILDSSNVVAINKCVPGLNTINVTLTGAPGAVCKFLIWYTL